MGRIHSKQESVKSALLGVGRMLGLPKYFLITNCRDRRLRRDNYFAINANFYGPLMMSRLPILDKIVLLGSMIIDIFKQKFHFTKWRTAYGSVNSSRCIDRRCNFYSKE